MDDLIGLARAFAKRRHGDQRRKYDNTPYWHHLRNVAGIVEAFGGSEVMIAAAWAHDLVEDTDVTLDEVTAVLGFEVRTLVYYLSDLSRPEDGNRETRKAIDRSHIKSAPPEAQTIKLADLIDNTASIVQHDKNFARVYLAEKELLLEVLVDSDPYLRRFAFTTLRHAQRELVQHSLEKAEHGNK